MLGPFLMLFVLVGGVVFLLIWNKRKVKGKVLGFFLWGNLTTEPMLCEYDGDFVYYAGRCYELNSNYVRWVGYPSGWPQMLQERVPSGLWDVTNALQLDWKRPTVQRDARLRAMNIKSALSERKLQQVVEESVREPGAPPKRNWKKMLPIILIAGGIIGFIIISRMGGGIKLPGM